MKKYIKYTGIAISGALLFAACKKNNLVVDKGIVAPAFVKFNTTQAADTIGTYYIKSTNAAYNLPIGITNVSSVDRTIKFAYASSTGATPGTQYNAPASIIIKAGQTIDSLPVSGLFAGYPSASRIDTVKISIAGGDVPASDYKSKYTLILRKYCDVALTDFYGSYKTIDNGNYGPYSMGIVSGSGVSTGETSGTLQVTNLWDYGVITTITVAIDWADPKSFKVTIPDQEFVGTDNVWIKNSASVGSFSSCDQTFTFKYTLYYKSTGANYYANQSSIMKR